MTTKDAVRTSILSKQWRYVWTSIPIIEIDDMYLLFPYGRPPLKDVAAMDRCFLDFVDRVLHLNDVSCLRKFCLSCCEFYDFSRVSAWISAVITRNVEVLDLWFIYEQQVMLPPKFFTCNKLVILKLKEGFRLNAPTSAYLPSLKILHLHRVILDDDVSLNNLLDGCPILRELDMETDFCPCINILFVRSSSLRTLKLDNRAAYYSCFKLGIAVDTPNLERLELTCDMTQQCHVNSLSSLVEVEVDICSDILYLKSIEAGGYRNQLVELVRKMSNTKCMCLSKDIIRSLGRTCLDNLPMFHYLTRLVLSVDECSWNVLPYLLECSPNLITCLFYTGSASVLYGGESVWHKQFRKPKCFMLYLEEIEIRHFKGCANGMKMVKYFLKNATVLKKMSIWSSGSKNEEILKKLLTFPTSSTTCQIAFN